MVNEINLKGLAELYLENARKHRNFISDYDIVRDSGIVIMLGLDGLVKELKKYADEYGGCVSCCYSRPHERAPTKLLARTCVFKLSQETCRRWRRIQLE